MHDASLSSSIKRVDNRRVCQIWLQPIEEANDPLTSSELNRKESKITWSTGYLAIPLLLLQQ